MRPAASAAMSARYVLAPRGSSPNAKGRYDQDPFGLEAREKSGATDMRLSTAIRSVLAAIAKRNAARRRLAEFPCADCERWEQCDLAPSAHCIGRQEQIARGDWEDRR